MSIRNDNHNHSFTKQTAMILEGLGAGDLIPQFKRRNISTQALSQLSKEDFMTIGANKDLSQIMVKQLRLGSEKNEGQVIDDQDKTAQLIEILKSGSQQLSLIKAFINFTRHKLGQKPTEYIIDINNNMRASEALRIATKYAICEINKLQDQSHQLLINYVCKTDIKKTSNNRIRTVICGISLTVCLIYTCRYVVYFIKNC